MKRSYYLLPMLVVALFPSVVLANAGTPLIWVSMLHLVLGNVIIGIFEGSLFLRVFKYPKYKLIRIMIAANYASAWAGGFFIVGYLAFIPDITIKNIQFWFITFSIVAFLATILIELPFFWFLLRTGKKPLRQALIATFVINSISYTLLFGWYWLASGTSMMTRLEVMSSNEMRPSVPYVLYFLSPDGGQVLFVDLNDLSSRRSIAKVAAFHRDDRLFVRHRVDSGFDLFVRIDSEIRGKEKELLLIESFSKQAPVEWRIAKKFSDKSNGTRVNFGSVPSLANASDWEFYTGFWPVEGIRGKNFKTGKSTYFSLEIPFAAWAVRNATHLEGDYLVFQLGDDQICIMHPESRKIALIARGKGPIVAKPKMLSQALSADVNDRVVK